MKRTVTLVIVLAIATALVGCDEATLTDAAKTMFSAQPLDGYTLSGDALQQQLQIRLRDGECDGSGDGNQNNWEHGGSNGQGGNDGRSGNGGNGDQDRLRLRDGSCSDG